MSAPVDPRNPYQQIIARHRDTTERDMAIENAFLHGDIAKLPAVLKGVFIHGILGTALGVPGELADQFTKDTVWGLSALVRNATYYDTKPMISGRELEASQRGKWTHKAVDIGAPIGEAVASMLIPGAPEAKAGETVLSRVLPAAGRVVARAATGSLADPAVDAVLAKTLFKLPALARAARKIGATPTVDDEAIKKAADAAHAFADEQDNLRRAKYAGQPIDAQFTVGGTGPASAAPAPGGGLPTGIGPTPATPARSPAVQRALAAVQAAPAPTPIRPSLAERPQVARLGPGAEITPAALPEAVGPARGVTAPPDYSTAALNESINADLASGTPGAPVAPPVARSSPAVAYRDKLKGVYGGGANNAAKSFAEKYGMKFDPTGQLTPEGEAAYPAIADYLDKAAALPQPPPGASKADRAVWKTQRQALRDELEATLAGGQPAPVAGAKVTVDPDTLPGGQRIPTYAQREAQIDREDLLGTLVSGGRMPHERAAAARTVGQAAGVVPPAESSALREEYWAIQQAELSGQISREEGDRLAAEAASRQAAPVAPSTAEFDQQMAARAEGNRARRARRSQAIRDRAGEGVPGSTIAPAKARAEFGGSDVLGARVEGLPVGRLGRPPARGNNYDVQLSGYTDRLYRQARPEELAGGLVDWDPYGPGARPEVWLANTPDLALGQGGNANGILMEFLPAGIEGRVNTAMPTWEPVWAGGAGEFISRAPGSRVGLANLRSITLPPRLTLDAVTNVKLKRILARYEAEGWTKEVLADGSRRYTHPEEVGRAVAEAAPPAPSGLPDAAAERAAWLAEADRLEGRAPNAPIEFGGGVKTSISDAPIPTGPAPAMKLQMQYGGLPEAQVSRLQQEAAGQSSLFTHPFDTPALQDQFDRVAAAHAAMPEGPAKAALREQTIAASERLVKSRDLPPAAADPFGEDLSQLAPEGHSPRGEWLARVTEAAKAQDWATLDDLAARSEDYGYRSREANRVIDSLTEGGGAALSASEELARVESSPYAGVFKYFNSDGTLKRIDTRTGKPLPRSRDGGRFRTHYDEPWNEAGTHYDEVAAAAMGGGEGYSAAAAPTTDEFFINAQKAFLSAQRAKKGLPPLAEHAWEILTGGGGRLGITPKLPPASAAFGAAAGAAGGAIAGGQVGDTPEERARGAALGFLGGAAGGALAGPRVGGAARKLVNSTDVQLLREGAWQGVAREGKAWREGTVSKSLLIGDMMRQFVETPGGAILDRLSNYTRAIANGLPIGYMAEERASILRRIRAGENTAIGDRASALMKKVGIDDPDLHDFPTKLGQGAFHMDHEGPLLHPLAAMGAGVVGSSVGPGMTIPLLGQLWGGLRGLGREFAGTMFRVFNDADQAGTRSGAFAHEAAGMLDRAATVFKEALERQGIDASSLPDHGQFKPAQAEAVAPGMGQIWKGVIDQIFGKVVDPALKGEAKVAAVKANRGLAADAVNEVFGDYGTPGARENAMRKVLMFAKYTVGQYPVLLRMAQQHPAAAMALVRYIASDQRAAQREGRPLGQVGTIPVSTEFPGLGGVARLLTGGAKGEARVGVTNALFNVSGSNLGDFAGIQQGFAERNPYKVVDGILGAAGLGFNPAIEAGAFALGGTDRAPSTSRMGGFEGALPGPTSPTVTALLNRVRMGLGAEDATIDRTDLKAKEIILRETKKPASDPSNARFIPQLLDPESPLMRQAAAEVGHASAFQNLLSVASPIRPTGVTAERTAYQQSKANQATAIAAGQRPTGAAAMFYDPKYPSGSINREGNKVDPGLREFRNQYSVLRSASPKLYESLEQEFIRAHKIPRDKQ